MPDPTGLQAVAVLLTALGLSSVTGLRAYFPVLAVAVASDVATSDGAHLITLSKPFQALGTWWFIALLVVLALGELTVDKIPVLDHISDALHTLIRPLAGAVVMAGTSNPLSEHSLIAAAIVGAVLSLMVHGVKATSRPAVTAATGGLGNPVVSAGEDVLVVVMTALALLAPIIAAIVLVVLAALVVLLIRAGWRKLRARRAAAQPAAALNATQPRTPPDSSFLV